MPNVRSPTIGRARQFVTFVQARQALYAVTMNTPRISLAKATALGAVTVTLAALSGIAFAGWLGQSGDMLVSLAASGLAWCF